MEKKNEELIAQMTTSMFFKKTILEETGLSPLIWEKYLAKNSIRKNIMKDEYLLRIGDKMDGIYFIRKGKIRSNFLGKDGFIKTLITLEEGCLFGEHLIFHEQPCLYETVVIEDAELYFFEKNTILKLMKKDFNINIYLIQVMSIKTRMLGSQMEDICMRNIPQAICRLLYTLCCYEEKKDTFTGDVLISLSHQDLANMLASHRVTISRNMHTLKEQEILDYKYEKIIIKDREKLKEIAFGI